MSDSVLPLVALTGSPNCGKTALFNALTGASQKVANYGGVTVERKEGQARTSSGKELRILDLPGVYSLNPASPDEAITRDVILNRNAEVDEPRVLIAVADATNLERSLSFALELKTVRKPVVLVLNMMDLARRRGLDLDVACLEAELGIPVVPTVAVKKAGVTELLSRVEAVLDSQGLPERELKFSDPKTRFEEVDRVLRMAVRAEASPSIWTDRIDSLVLHPVSGTLVLVTVLMFMFQAVFTWAGPFQDAIETGFAWVGSLILQWVPPGALQSLLVDGIIAGVGGVLVFLPQILLLFFFILLLEDSGYMARAAFLMDKLMGKAGLHGRAFIPLLSSFACAIPGIMSTRTIENKRDRLSTILVAPLITCAARLPVYSLLIAAFIPDLPLWGPFRLQGMVMFGLYFFGVLSAILVALMFKKTILKGATPPLVMDLPTYKFPSVRNLLFALLERCRAFIKRAGTIILTLTVILWFLSSYPKAPQGATEPAISYSYAGKIGRVVEPLIRPIGFDWKVGVALIPGFAAREVMVGALATVYAVEANNEESVERELGSQLSAGWSLATALSLIVWYVFAPQCLATLAVTRRETNSWRWPIFMMVYLTALAYVASWLMYRAALWFGWGGGL